MQVAELFELDSLVSGMLFPLFSPEVGKQLGFVGCKVPCPFGPADGHEGFAKNAGASPKNPRNLHPGFGVGWRGFTPLTIITIFSNLCHHHRHHLQVHPLDVIIATRHSQDTKQKKHLASTLHHHHHHLLLRKIIPVASRSSLQSLFEFQSFLPQNRNDYHHNDCHLYAPAVPRPVHPSSLAPASLRAQCTVSSIHPTTQILNVTHATIPCLGDGMVPAEPLETTCAQISCSTRQARP